MKQIVKVIFEDETFLEIKNIIPLEISSDKKTQWLKNRNYERQFKDFEDKILENVNPDNTKKYAIDYFYLVEDEHEEHEEKQIADFDDDEIMEEVRDRKLLGNYNSIISESFLIRFSNIIEKENQLLLDSLLTELEMKLNL